MIRRHLGVAVAALIALSATAHAGKLVLPDIHGEADVADEAAAVTMLVRSALLHDSRTLVQPEQLPPRVSVALAPATLAKIGADTAILGELVREGTGLRVTVILVDKDGTSTVSLVRAGDGDVRGLAAGIVTKIAAVTHVPVGAIPAIGLGRLHPYIAASTTGAAALADAIPTTAIAAPGATWGLGAIVAKTDDPRTKLVAARALGARQEVDAVAANAKPPVSTVAKALAAVDRARIGDADAAIGPAGKREDGLVSFARAVLADAHGQAIAPYLADALAGDPQTVRLALAFASRPDAKLPPELHKAAVALAERSAETSPGVAARIGLHAARAGVDVPRALALVRVHELDDTDLPIVEQLATGDSPTALRLRAELAMRRADGTEAVAIAAYLKAAPHDQRAHLYAGYQAMSEGKYDVAANEFAGAGAARERAHAQLLGDDLQGALITIAHDPVTPEELVVKARIAVKANNIVDAQAAIETAEQTAPANPYVQQALALVAKQKGATIEPSRATFANTIADTGTAKTEISSAGTVTTTAAIVDSAAAGSGAPIAATSKTKRHPVDERLEDLDITKLLAALPALSRMTNRKIAIAQRTWSPTGLSWRKTTPENLKPVLENALSAPPYRLEVVARRNLDSAPNTTAMLDTLLGDTGALLTYMVEASGGDAKITLEIFPAKAKTSEGASDSYPGAGLVGIDYTRALPIGIVLLVVLLAGLFLATKGSGTIRIAIDRALDASDEVFCVEITRSAKRPKVGDPNAFKAAQRKAGSKTARRSATLIANGAEFRVSPGEWYVHLYGTYDRSGVTLPLPETATAKVKVKRSTENVAKIDLAPKTAEIVVQIEGDLTERVGVSVDDGPLAYTEQGTGMLVLAAKFGHHVLSFEAKGHTFKRELATPQARIYRFPFNLKRELRIIEAGLDGSSTISAAARPSQEDLAPSADDMPEDIILANPVDPIAAGETMAAPGQAARISLPDEFMADAQAAIAQANASAKAAEVGVKFGKTAAIVAQTAVDGGEDRLLARYRKTAELGRGAMGVVWRAWDENLEREVAIKVMADELQKNQEALRLFNQEAKALAQLNHTNIVAVYDQQTVGAKTYMIMEYVDGVTLEKLAEGRGAFPVKEAIDLIDQLLAGLSFAHARRVIHRDIKPANIFIARDGTVKVGDFGLARIARELTIRKTEVRGTPLYMAPEQIMGTDLDHRVDLYAVGCTLYELLCGKPPFLDGDILYHQLHTPPVAPSKLRAGLPRGLDTLLLALLAKAADERPASASDVRTALKSI